MPLLVIYSGVGELRAVVLLLVVLVLLVLLVPLLHFSNPPSAVFLTRAISQNIIIINLSLFSRVMIITIIFVIVVYECV